MVPRADRRGRAKGDRPMRAWLAVTGVIAVAFVAGSAEVVLGGRRWQDRVRQEVRQLPR